MTTSDFIDVRYGDAVGIRYLSPEDHKECFVRRRNLCNALAKILDIDIAEPRTRNVHSPRALPAYFGSKGGEPVLVWDAGLGTLFDQLSFPMTYIQPPEVVEAIVRRIAGIRYVVAGWRERGAAQVARAQALLKQTPIDRTYQMLVDAEDQCEVFLLTEMQECFVLAHELGHYLWAVAERSVGRFMDTVVDSVKQGTADLAEGVLPRSNRGVPGDRSGDLYEAGLDPWAWYLSDQHPAGWVERSWSSLVSEVAVAHDLLLTANAHEREEILCDLLGALAVALDAHERQLGRTAMMGAACSRLALSNVQAILGIDEWVSQRSDRPTDVALAPTPRQTCLNVLLPIMLPQVLSATSHAYVPPPSDIYSVMRSVEDKFLSHIGPALLSLDRVECDEQARTWSEDQVLARATFLPLRPEPDHRVVNRAAREFE